MRRKLIETLFPVTAISAACAAEATRRTGQPSQLHPYWARRPLALARATILAQVLDDPASRPDRFPTPEDQARERHRLVHLVERLAAWDPASSDDAVVDEARAEIARTVSEADPRDGAPPPPTDGGPVAAFHDPFAGSGAIAIEAQRLGLDTHASDLNPLAALISTVSLAFAPTFAGRPPVGAPPRAVGDAPAGAARPTDGLARDVVHYGATLFHRANRRLGHLYPPATMPADGSRPSLADVGQEALPVVSWIWARTIPSPNPAFAHVHVPLVTTFVLDARPAEAAHLAIGVDGDRWTPRVVDGPPKDRRAADLGTRLDRVGFRCVLSGTPITFDAIDEAARRGHLGTRLVAVVAARPDGRHAYLAPDAAQAVAAAQAIRPDDLPDLPVTAAWGGRARRTYGFNVVGDLFTDRQAQLATTLCDLVGEVRNLVQADAITAGQPVGVPFHAGGNGAAAYADAVATLLALAVSRHLATGNALAQWHPAAGRVRDAFARQALAMAWDFAEVNPFVSRAAGLRRAFTQVASGLAALPLGHGHAFLADARTAVVPPGTIVTADPPYYGAVQYADLSDFFYAWLRRPLRHIHPDLFATLATPQADELVVNDRPGSPVRHGNDDYERGLADAFRAVAARARPDIPLACITTVRPGAGDGGAPSSEPAYASLAILVRAGLQVTALWPVRTDPPGVLRLAGTDASPSPAVVVARQRPADAGTMAVREFLARATPAVVAAARRLRGAGVPPATIAISAVGPGLEVFTSADAVVGADGAPMALGVAVDRLQAIAIEALERDDDARDDLRWPA